MEYVARHRNPITGQVGELGREDVRQLGPVAIPAAGDLSGAFGL